MRRLARFCLWTLPLLWLVGCSEKDAAPPPNPGVPVMVAKAIEKPMPVELHAIGTGEAYSTVSIESQIAGIVEGIHFQEGQFVKKGDLLFTLDSRPWVAALQQAEANLAKDKAQAELDEVQAERYEKLYAAGVVPKEQYDQYRATADAAKATVRADEAAVENAKLNLQYCSIYASIDGRTGSLLVHPGSVVKANDLPVMVIVNQIVPLYVDFSVPEQYLDAVKRFMARERLPVDATPADSTEPEKGYLSFIDNTVDNTTGMIKLKGTFSNLEHRLWPGEFVNVVLRLEEQKDAIVVPSQAVLAGQNGQYVFVLKPDMTVDSRPVVVARTVGNEAVVEKGIQPGETVVTDGQVRLIPGTKVYVKTSL